MKKILLIDDDEAVAGAVKRNVEISGDYEVMVESNPLQALKTASEIDPNIIVLDLVMPELNGCDVAIQLKNNDNTKGIPVIFLTASINLHQGNIPAGFDINEYVTLTKPISGDDLIKTIEAVLQGG